MTFSWISLAVASVLTVLAAPGCGTSATEPSPSQARQQFPNWPALLDEFRFHWSAAPGIDITTGPALIACAYMESYGVASFTLDADNVYPGFNRATPEDQKREGNYPWRLVNIRPVGLPITATPDHARPQYGYEVLHFVELTPLGTATARSCAVATMRSSSKVEPIQEDSARLT